MAWIEAHQSLATHDKLFILTEELDCSRYEAIGILMCLWWWAIDARPDGDLSRVSPKALEVAVTGYQGHRLIDALKKSGFVDEDGRIHDWNDYAGRLIEKRRAHADRVRAQRKSHDAKRDGHVTRTVQVTRPVTFTPYSDRDSDSDSDTDLRSREACSDRKFEEGEHQPHDDQSGNDSENATSTPATTHRSRPQATKPDPAHRNTPGTLPANPGANYAMFGDDVDRGQLPQDPVLDRLNAVPECPGWSSRLPLQAQLKWRENREQIEACLARLDELGRTGVLGEILGDAATRPGTYGQLRFRLVKEVERHAPTRNGNPAHGTAPPSVFKGVRHIKAEFEAKRAAILAEQQRANS